MIEPNHNEYINAPLVVDLDGTLIQSDMLLESFVRVLKSSPWLIFLVPFWLLKGKSELKSQLARRAVVDVSALPYHEGFLDYLKNQKSAGRTLILATGSHQDYAQKIADHLGLFEQVYATTDSHNLTGANKATLLEKDFGNRGFSYAGNESKDRHIWKSAASAVVVSNSEKLKQDAAADTQIEAAFETPKAGLKLILKAMRIHQWVKNALIFFPLVTSHLITSGHAVASSLTAFLSFGLVASGTYIINDLFDLDSDRTHATKKNRPFAAGTVSIQMGLLLSAGLIGGGFVTLLLLPPQFAAVLIVYFIVTLSYSLRLKAVTAIDVLILAFLYTIRVIAGAAAIQVAPSFWLLAFSLFLFLCLAIMKRVSELINMKAANKTKAKGRGYQVTDLPVLESLGTSGGYMSVLVMALYINSPSVTPLYQTPEFLWLICPLILFWVTRVWILTARGLMNEDPIVFAIKDKMSWIIGALAGIAILLATQVNL